MCNPSHEERFGAHHIVVVVMRESLTQTVRGFTRLSVAHVIGQDQVMCGSVQRLAGLEQFLAEILAQEGAPGAARAVQDEDGVGDAASGILRRLTDREIVQAQFGEPVAGMKGEIAGDPIALGLIGVAERSRLLRPGSRHQQQRAPTHHS